MIGLYLRVLVGVVLLLTEAKSQTDVGSPPVSDTSASPSQEVQTSPKKKRSKGSSSKRRANEKEIEGTEAPGRFEAETIIRSHYQYEGRPVEVDPD